MRKRDSQATGVLIAVPLAIVLASKGRISGGHEHTITLLAAAWVGLQSARCRSWLEFATRRPLFIRELLLTLPGCTLIRDVGRKGRRK
jgi:hypothetical protein